MVNTFNSFTIKRINQLTVILVRMIGVEPTWITPLDPKSSASANFATSGILDGKGKHFVENMEGF